MFYFGNLFSLRYQNLLKFPWFLPHARALINIDDIETQLTILKNILSKDLSVRKVEEIVRNLSQDGDNPKEEKHIELPEKYVTIKKQLIEKLEVKVDVKCNNKGKGSIVIPFKSNKEFERIIATLV